MCSKIVFSFMAARWAVYVHSIGVKTINCIHFAVIFTESLATLLNIHDMSVKARYKVFYKLRNMR